MAACASFVHPFGVQWDEPGAALTARALAHTSIEGEDVHQCTYSARVARFPLSSEAL